MTKTDRKKVVAMARRFEEERDQLWDRLLSELQGDTKADAEDIEEAFSELT